MLVAKRFEPMRDERHSRLAVEDRQRLFEPGRRQPVIGIQCAEVLPVRMGGSGVSSGGQASILSAQNPGRSPFVRGELAPRRLISRPVVDDDDLEVLTCLDEHAFDCLVDPRAMIEAGDEDGDPWHGTQPAASALEEARSVSSST